MTTFNVHIEESVDKNPFLGRMGKLSIVGAGPGDIELITLKAVKALQSADVVLYDALVDKRLLEYAEYAEKIYVGKRRGCYVFQQEQINELIVECARRGLHVVRLKGGDPFVFGRGAEEMQYAAEKGIDVQLIPGISSCISVPAAVDIPVTKRGASESFWVITGTTRDHQLSSDIELAAKSSATVVVLMGMAKLAPIMDLFKKEGKSETAVAVIQNGTTKRERIAVGTVNTITEEVAGLGLSNPAIIIIGEVVRHREKMNRIRDKISIKEHA